MTIEALYQERAALRGPEVDMPEHMPLLRAYAAQCRRVVEFGVREGFSTTAFLASGCPQVWSFDVNAPAFACPEDVRARWRFTQADTRELSVFPVCDALFIDTWHTAEQLRAELRFHIDVRRWIILHDHIRWGSVGEDKRPGLIEAILEFLIAQPGWRPVVASSVSMGLLVLERQELSEGEAKIVLS